MDRAPPLLRGEGILIAETTMRACVNVRGNVDNERFVRAVARVADVAPPRVSGASVAGLLASILWLGPDEWLLTSETQRGDELGRRLRTALNDVHSAVTDVSSATIVYSVRGAKARDVLAKGCSLDLHSSGFTPGMCARTLLGKASVLVHLRSKEPEFEVYVARSFREYAWAWLRKASGEFRPGPVV